MRTVKKATRRPVARRTVRRMTLDRTIASSGETATSCDNPAMSSTPRHPLRHPRPHPAAPGRRLRPGAPSAPRRPARRRPRRRRAARRHRPARPRPGAEPGRRRHLRRDRGPGRRAPRAPGDEDGRPRVSSTRPTLKKTARRGAGQADPARGRRPRTSGCTRRSACCPRTPTCDALTLEMLGSQVAGLYDDDQEDVRRHPLGRHRARPSRSPTPTSTRTRSRTRTSRSSRTRRT